MQVNARITIPDEELKFTFARSSGPGGQNVNKVNTKAVLHWSLDATQALPEDVRQRLRKIAGRRINQQGELVLQSDRYRVQTRNVDDCLARLKDMILAAVERPKRRKPTKIPRRAKEARLREKKQTADKKRLRRSTGDT